MAKSFSKNLQHSMQQQESSVKDRFAAADSVLLSTPTAELKSKAKPAVTIEDMDRAVKAKAVASHNAASSLVIRDTFSLPPSDYALIEELRTTAAKSGQIATKSEVIRAGLRALKSLQGKQLADQLVQLEKIKPGRK